MDDATVFVLILVIIILLFMQFYFVSYRKDAFILLQLDRLAERVKLLEGDTPAPA